MEAEYWALQRRLGLFQSNAVVRRLVLSVSIGLRRRTLRLATARLRLAWTRSRIMERSNSARARSDFILCRHVPLQNLTNKNSSRSCIPYTALRAKTFTVSIQRSGMGVDPFHRSGELTLRRQRSEELRVSVR